MLRDLLSERFQLKMHQEAREMPVYFLLVGRGGPKLKTAALPEQEWHGARLDSDGFIDLRPGVSQVVGGGKGGDMHISARKQTMDDLAKTLAQLSGRPVIDKTGLSGSYDYKLAYLTTAPQLGQEVHQDPLPVVDPGPDLADALQRQLGLKLESGKALVDCLVVDKLSKPSLD